MSDDGIRYPFPVRFTITDVHREEELRVYAEALPANGIIRREIRLNAAGTLTDSASDDTATIESGVLYHLTVTGDGFTVQTDREAWDAAEGGTP